LDRERDGLRGDSQSGYDREKDTGSYVLLVDNQDRHINDEEDRPDAGERQAHSWPNLSCAVAQPEPLPGVDDE
jgi:hypothetical protein